jgi:hypothetical protein
MPTHQVVASLGLVLDIIGAWLIVRSLLWISDDELAKAADRTAVFGEEGKVFPRPELMRMFQDTRKDARLGFALLAAGFIGQLVGAWI